MTYIKQLPRLDNLRRLAQLAGPFPITARMIIFYAQNHGLDDNLIDLLCLFHPAEVFQSRADFITRCNELELIIKEWREMPKEVLRSPQD